MTNDPAYQDHTATIAASKKVYPSETVLAVIVIEHSKGQHKGEAFE